MVEKYVTVVQAKFCLAKKLRRLSSDPDVEGKFCTSLNESIFRSRDRPKIRSPFFFYGNTRIVRSISCRENIASANIQILKLTPGRWILGNRTPASCEASLTCCERQATAKSAKNAFTAAEPRCSAQTPYPVTPLPTRGLIVDRFAGRVSPVSSEWRSVLHSLSSPRHANSKFKVDCYFCCMFMCTRLSQLEW